MIDTAVRAIGSDPANSNRSEYFTIGDLSREFGVTLRALRFYEDKGLLSPKREGLTRLYSRTDRNRLVLILKGKRFGFTLTEIKAMVAAHEGRDEGENLALSQDKVLQQIAVLEKQRQEIDDAIAELRSNLQLHANRSTLAD
ncbi:MerR family transcriptional regulator [Blastochloris viridis]|nr:MerR family DNA-binding transcriptional regulator [Blastochloris viridis]